MVDLLIHRTFFHQMLEKSQFAKLPRYTVTNWKEFQQWWSYQHLSSNWIMLWVKFGLTSSEELPLALLLEGIHFLAAEASNAIGVHYWQWHWFYHPSLWRVKLRSNLALMSRSDKCLKAVHVQLVAIHSMLCDHIMPCSQLFSSIKGKFIEPKQETDAFNQLILYSHHFSTKPAV